MRDHALLSEMRELARTKPWTYAHTYVTDPKYKIITEKQESVLKLR